MVKLNCEYQWKVAYHIMLLSEENSGEVAIIDMNTMWAEKPIWRLLRVLKKGIYDEPL